MDFEKIFDRRKDNSIKYNRYPENVLPLWIADMDFEVSEPIQKALQDFIKTGIYGYATPPEELAEVIIQRFQERYQWKVQREWIVWLPSVLSGISGIAQYISLEPYTVMTSAPVYQPFMQISTSFGRSLQAVPLKSADENFTMDFAAMEELVDQTTKMYILSNPHNPTGRVYSANELRRLAEFCLQHNLLLCSDEIHADILINTEKKHVPVASLSEEIAMNTISLYSAGKAFNIPGLSSGFAIIPNETMRKGFEKIIHHYVPNMFKLAGDASLAAYRDSGDWLEKMLEYIRGNCQYLFEEINKIKGLQMVKPEATYLAWICYEDLKQDDFVSILEEYGVGVIDASVYQGKNYFRLNFGTQRGVLEEAVKRIKAAVDSIN